MFKIVILIALVGCAAAGVVAPVGTVATDVYARPLYNFGYSVADGITGDKKSHSEHRDGDVVTGQYSVLDADGALRVVQYTADPVRGFNAVVSRQGGIIPPAGSAPIAAAVPVANAGAAIAHHPVVAPLVAAPAPVVAPVAAVKTFNGVHAFPYAAPLLRGFP